MNFKDVLKAINSVPETEIRKPILIARSDWEEKYFKKYYPGVEVIRAPQRIKEFDKWVTQQKN